MQSNIAAHRLNGPVNHKETSMSKSDTTKRAKDAFDPALEAPVALTPDQLAQIAGGFAAQPTLAGLVIRGGTMGIIQVPTIPQEFLF